ncbi:hypothetical protein [Flavobacterium cerinum]|uniref:Uncharacterized protein n=1 Tax=Flavobacterium cerinum TaxID=2502784 RepID=A0ABY5IRL2_9FLAO|nr:hypothetical protein [Flavobacterium cerinum]UUC45414.1 hypothetical protein NOX80_17535 [Flavobacterium cerinum]
MKKIAILFFIISFVSCQPKKDNTDNSKEQKATVDYTVAVKFISDYVTTLEKNKDENTTIQWIANNGMLTADFKNRYKELMDNARKDDPELGLGFDPILDAQDYPDKNYVIQAIDSVTGFVTVSSNDSEDFQVILKVVSDGSQSKVEGSGVINIPEDQRAPR